MELDFDTAVDKMLDLAAEDWRAWRLRGDYSTPDDFKSFRENIYRDGGRKYLRITSKQNNQAMVWGFVALQDGPKFRKGDILKAASFNAPATNKARGNIFDDDYSVAWTGPHYL